MMEAVLKSPMPDSPQPAFEIHTGITLKGQLSMVNDIVLTGTFEGDLQTLGCLTVASGGVMTGTIDAGSLVLREGNVVEARVKVGAPAKAIGKKPPAEAGKPMFTGLKRGFQKLKELALGKA